MKQTKRMFSALLTLCLLLGLLPTTARAVSALEITQQPAAENNYTVTATYMGQKMDQGFQWYKKVDTATAYTLVQEKPQTGELAVDEVIYGSYTDGHWASVDDQSPISVSYLSSPGDEVTVTVSGGEAPYESNNNVTFEASSSGVYTATSTGGTLDIYIDSDRTSVVTATITVKRCWTPLADQTSDSLTASGSGTYYCAVTGQDPDRGFFGAITNTVTILSPEEQATADWLADSAHQLTLGPVTVTADNAKDILGNGTAFFKVVNGTPTLTLDGVNITEGTTEFGGEIGLTCSDALTIVLAEESDNTITLTADMPMGIGIGSQYDGPPSPVFLTVTGKGTLTVDVTGSSLMCIGVATKYGVQVTGGAKLTATASAPAGVQCCGLYIQEEADLQVSGGGVVRLSGTAGAALFSGASPQIPLEEGYSIRGSTTANDFDSLTNASLGEYNGFPTIVIGDALAQSAVIAPAEPAHTHPVCGETCSGHTESHDSVEWTAWNGTGDSLTDGNYYLTKDVTRRTLNISGTVNLCLNGHTISSDSALAGGTEYLIRVGTSIPATTGTLNLCDCKNTGVIKRENDKGITTVSVYNSVLNLYGGTISGKGPTILLDCSTVNLYGGTVTGTAGAAITANTGSVDHPAKITVLGGTVTGTTNGIRFITGSGHGVLTLGGQPSISGENADIYLSTLSLSPFTSIGERITLLPGFVGKYSVILERPSKITETSPGIFTTAADIDYTQYFTAKNEDLAIRNISEGNQRQGLFYRPHAWNTETWEKNENGHWHKCTNDTKGGCTITDYSTCGEAGAAYAAHSGGKATCTAKAVCTTCGQSYGDLAAHTWGGTYEKDASQHWQTCSVCHTVTAKVDHSGGTATCTARAVCTTCGQSYGELVDHDFAGDYLSDASSHWHKCQNCDATDTKAAHTEDSGTVTKPATNTEKGVRTYKCSVCERVLRTEEIPMLTYSISGTVTDHNGSSNLTDVTVTLMQGNTEVARTTTSNGEYRFSSVKAGTYNVVAEQESGSDKITKTILVVLADADATEKNIKMPEGKKNSVVEVTGADTPAVVVGGVDEIAEAENPSTGETVTVKLTVEKKEESAAANASAIKQEASGKTLDFLDLKLTKKVGTEEAEDIGDKNTVVLEIVVPYDTSRQGVTVYRYHGGKVEKLTLANTGAGGTFKMGTDSVIIYATKFSTYAIGYTPDETPDPEPPSGGGGGGGGSATYPPTVEESEHGKVTVSPGKPARGDKVTVTLTPDSGYQPDGVTVTDRNGKPVAVTDSGGGVYTFTQPGGKVTIAASFKRASGRPAWNPFVDVAEEDWFHDSVKYVYEQGLMVGTDSSHFSPRMTTSRAMTVSILWRLEGEPETEAAQPFSDVADGQWYTQAIAWAAEEGVAEGYGEGRFGPGDPVTREQLASLLWRYAGKPTAPDLPLNFTDAGEASGYAQDALRWAVEQGILTGRGGGILDPTGMATRAEAAAMIQRFCEKGKETARR